MGKHHTFQSIDTRISSKTIMYKEKDCYHQHNWRTILYLHYFVLPLNIPQKERLTIISNSCCPSIRYRTGSDTNASHIHFLLPSIDQYSNCLFNMILNFKIIFIYLDSKELFSCISWTCSLLVSIFLQTEKNFNNQQNYYNRNNYHQNFFTFFHPVIPTTSFNSK